MHTSDTTPENSPEKSDEIPTSGTAGRFSFSGFWGWRKLADFPAVLAERRRAGCGRGGTLCAIGSWLILLGLLACLGRAYIIQSRLHHLTGSTPPGLEAFNLLGQAGRDRIAAMPETKAQLLKPYAVTAFLFAALALLIRRIYPSRPALRMLHLEPEPSSCVRQGRSGRGRLMFALFALLFLSAAALCILFTYASVRAELFGRPLDQLPAFDRILGKFYGLCGLKMRPNWWMPLVTWLLIVPMCLGTLWSLGNLLGYSWRRENPAQAHQTRIRLWEWLIVACVCVVATLGYFRDITTLPYVVQVDETNTGRAGYILTKKDSTESPFNNPIEPNTAFVTRAISSWIFGNSFASLRYVSAITSGFGLIIVYLLLRSMFGPPTSLMGLILTAGTHTVIQYSRIGIDNIDSFYWVYLMLYLFYRAEISCSGPARLGLYLMSGACCGGAFGLYTGAPLGAAAILGMAIIRAVGQPDFWSRRVWGYALFIGFFALMAAPFKLNTTYQFSRANQTYLLQTSAITFELNRPENKTNGIDSVDKFIMAHFKNAIGGFHWRSDNSFDYGSPFPLVGPLTGALSILGAAFLLFRFRSWLSFYIFGLYFSGCFLGGALQGSPYPPVSARLILVLPTVLLAATVGLDLVIQAFISATASIAGGGRRGRIGVWTMTAFGLCAAVWALVSEINANIAIYRRFLYDYTIFYHEWMSGPTEIWRFIIEHQPKPDYVYQFDVNPHSNLSYTTVDFYLPGTEWNRRFWIERNQQFIFSTVPADKQIMFVFSNARLNELEPVKAAFPGGKEYQTPPLPRPGAVSQYTIYEIFNTETRQGMIGGVQAPSGAVPGFDKILDALEQRPGYPMFNGQDRVLAFTRLSSSRQGKAVRWLTAPWSGRNASPLVFAGSFGGRDIKLQLTINGKQTITFTPREMQGKQVWENQGIKLAYEQISVNQGSHGIFTLALPDGFAEPNSPLEISALVVGAADESDWFGVRDAIAGRDF